MSKSILLMLFLSMQSWIGSVTGAEELEKANAKHLSLSDILRSAVEKFDSSLEDEKIQIVTKPLEGSWFFSRDNFPGAHMLSLAISLGDVNTVEKCLAVIHDINDEKLDVWGYRQPYTVANVALHPIYFLDGRGGHISEGMDPLGASLEDRIKIIHLLGRKGQDFSVVRQTSGYRYPPIDMGGHSSFTTTGMARWAMTGAILLYGVNPIGDGVPKEYDAITLFDTDQTLFKHAFILAFEQFKKLTSEERQCIRLHDYTRRMLKEVSEREKKFLQERLDALNQLVL